MKKMWGQWYLEFISFNSGDAESPETLHEEASAFANTMIDQQEPLPEEEDDKAENP